MALRSDNHQQALDAVNHYLDSPLEKWVIDERFLLQLWDENKAKGENPGSSRFRGVATICSILEVTNIQINIVKSMTKRNIPYIHTLHLALTPRSREEPFSCSR